MELDQRLDLLGAMTAPAAVGGDPEVVDEALGGDEAGLGADQTVGGVQQPEVQAGLGAQGELAERLEEGDVDASALHGQVDPVERPAQAERQGVGDVDECLRVVRALAVVALVPVAEVVAEPDVRRDAAPEPDEALDDARPGIVEPRRHDPVEHGELEVGVPLDRQLVVRDGLEDRRQLVEDAGLVERLDVRLVLGRDEGGDRRQRRRQRHLEPAVPRDLAVALAAGEDVERRQGRLGVAEVVEAQRVQRLTVADPQARQLPVRVGTGRAHLELRARAEHRVLPDDPVRPWPGLAVGELADPVPQLDGHHLEHLFGAAQRNAADQQHTLRRDALTRVRHRAPPGLSSGPVSDARRRAAKGVVRRWRTASVARCASSVRDPNISGTLISCRGRAAPVYLAAYTSARGSRGDSPARGGAMKRSLLGFAAAAVLVLAACGDDDDDDGPRRTPRLRERAPRPPRRPTRRRRPPPRPTPRAATTAPSDTGAATTAPGSTAPGDTEPPAGGGPSNIQASGECGLGTGEPADGEPIKIGAMATNIPGVDFTWITSMTGAYFQCVNDNGGINGRPIQYIAEEEQVDPQQIASLATKLIEQDQVLGIVGSTSLIECSVNRDYYAAQEYYLIIAGVAQDCFTSPNFSAVNMGPYYSSLGGAQAAVRAGAEGKLVVVSPNQPGFDLINSGVVQFAEENGMEGESILEDVPINDPAGLAQRLVQAAGDGGGVVLDFTGPTVLPLLQAIEQQGLDRLGDLGQLDAAERHPSVTAALGCGVERQVPHQRRVQRARLRAAGPEPHERGPRAVRVGRPELELRPDGLPRRACRHRRAARDRGRHHQGERQRGVPGDHQLHQRHLVRAVVLRQHRRQQRVEQHRPHRRRRRTATWSRSRSASRSPNFPTTRWRRSAPPSRSSV